MICLSPLCRLAGTSGEAVYPQFVAVQYLVGIKTYFLEPTLNSLDAISKFGQFSFAPRCLRSITCINEYLAIGCGGNTLSNRLMQ